MPRPNLAWLTEALLLFHVLAALLQNTQPGTAQPAATGTGGDALDKGVAAALNKSGHGGQKAGTIEKISDGIRTGFKKLTGKDVPVKDQTYQ
ncbi:hypothetical protein JCM10908_001176 [Rhodotorula pacifica]|uniref:uncharacterized protein n=1 Tax=Rhodotorula pacifica TaxID=1495444 RepID=UPI003180FF24